MATTGSWATPEMENMNMDNSSSSLCGGAVVLLSDDFHYAAAGSSIAFDCRAVGLSRIYWVLPGHKVGTAKDKENFSDSNKNMLSKTDIFRYRNNRPHKEMKQKKVQSID